MIIQDDFCPDPKALDFLSQHNVWEPMLGKFHWWSGWWKEAPRNNWEAVIQNIWKNRGVEQQIAGFEYWCNILSADSETDHLGWHRDKDEALKAAQGKTVCPAMGTVFYGFPHKIEGGFLELACDDTFNDVERIAPIYNRLVIFDASRQHRVTRVYRGQRYGLQINLWVEKPMTFAHGETSTSSY